MTNNMVFFQYFNYMKCFCLSISNTKWTSQQFPFSVYSQYPGYNGIDIYGQEYSCKSSGSDFKNK